MEISFPLRAAFTPTRPDDAAFTLLVFLVAKGEVVAFK